MHALGAHFYSRQFGDSIFGVKTQSPPSIHVVNDWLSISLFHVSKLHHAYSAFGAIEMIEELLF